VVNVKTDAGLIKNYGPRPYDNYATVYVAKTQL